MKKYYVSFRGTNKRLAIAEFSTLWNLYFDEMPYLIEMKNTIYSFDSNIELKKDEEIFRRLTFTNQFFFEIYKGEKLDEIKFDFDYQSFAVDFRTQKKLEIPFSIEELAEPIWQSMKRPKVDLKNPSIRFTYLFFEDKKDFILTIKLHESQKDFLRRMPKLRAVVKPYTLKSDMARVAVNLLNLKEGLILDPFCGIGGVLLEAKDMNFNILANDISWNDLHNLDRVFEAYFSDFRVDKVLADSSNQFLKENSIDGIVTDIPYGKSSQKIGGELYEDFLVSARNYLKNGHRMVVIYANFVEFKCIALKYFREVVEIDQYINKSMTRHILVLENSL